MIIRHLTFIFFSALIVVLFCGCAGADKRPAEETGRNAGRFSGVYEISEFLEEAQYDEYMNDAGALFDRLRVFRQKLENSSEFDFYAAANNFIEVINREIPETGVVNHGTEYAAESEYEIGGNPVTAADAIQVSENFFALFPLNVSEGRSFDAADFDCRNAETVPVILGNAYRDSFCLGDTFEGYYICERRTFTVIGFTDAASELYLRSRSCMAPYADLIIMPFETVEEDSYAARAILLQQICGFLVPHNGIGSAAETVQAYLTESGLEDWGEAIAVFEKSLQEKLA